MTNPDGPTPDPGDLDGWMNFQRKELGLRWKEVARIAGVQRQTLWNARQGVSVSELTDRKLEKALHWARGSMAAIRAGGVPTIEVEEAAPPVDLPPADPEAREIYDSLAPLPHDQRMRMVKSVLTARRREEEELATDRDLSVTKADPSGGLKRRHA